DHGSGGRTLACQEAIRAAPLERTNRIDALDLAEHATAQWPAEPFADELGRVAKDGRDQSVGFANAIEGERGIHERGQPSSKLSSRLSKGVGHPLSPPRSSSGASLRPSGRRSPAPNWSSGSTGIVPNAAKD